MQKFSVEPLGAGAGKALAKFLRQQPEVYRQEFHPFPEESPEALGMLLKKSEGDRFYAVSFGGEWVAFYMLRGWAAGYVRPSFGLLVDSIYQKRGLGKLCLSLAIAECRLLQVEQMMLKVAPANLPAVSIYERAGFSKESVCSETGHDIMVLNL